MEEYEIVKGIQDLVKAYPNDQSLGIKVREFINKLPNMKKVIPTQEEYLRGQIELEKKNRSTFKWEDKVKW